MGEQQLGEGEPGIDGAGQQDGTQSRAAGHEEETARVGQTQRVAQACQNRHPRGRRRIADQGQERQHRGNADDFEKRRDPESQAEPSEAPPVVRAHHPQEIEEGPQGRTERGTEGAEAQLKPFKNKRLGISKRGL